MGIALGNGCILLSESVVCICGVCVCVCTCVCGGGDNSWDGMTVWVYVNKSLFFHEMRGQEGKCSFQCSCC